MTACHKCIYIYITVYCMHKVSTTIYVYNIILLAHSAALLIDDPRSSYYKNVLRYNDLSVSTNVYNLRYTLCKSLPSWASLPVAYDPTHVYNIHRRDRNARKNRNMRLVYAGCYSVINLIVARHAALLLLLENTLRCFALSAELHIMELVSFYSHMQFTCNHL